MGKNAAIYRSCCTLLKPYTCTRRVTRMASIREVA